MKTLCLIDGEHYLPVTRDALEQLRDEGHDLRAAVFIGGTEKIGTPQEVVDQLGLPVHLPRELRKGVVPIDEIVAACRKHGIQEVIDISDEPVVNYVSRFEIASALMRLGIAYRGADFLFTPPRFERILEKPSLAIIGTAKRVGKTAVAGYVARLLTREGYNPLVVTMGRGGPPEPEVIRGDRLEMTPAYMLEQAEAGKHAASDHYEDALTTRCITVGCRRCGGGMAGQVFVSNVPAGARKANEFDADLVIMEGSGATMPPIHTETRIVIVGAHQPIEFIAGYMGTYRVSIADLVIIAMCEEPLATPAKVRRVEKAVHRINPDATVVPTIFRPLPLTDIRDRKVLLVMTAPEEIIVSGIIPYLEREHGCEVVGHSPHLSNRPLLRKDIARHIDRAEVVLTEVKAAAIDVATREALEHGLEVVYLDNILLPLGDRGLDEAIPSLDEAILDVAASARRGFGG